MHDDALGIDVGTVRRLVANQFPRWRNLPVEQFRSTGTVNAVFRLGDDLCVRLPRVARWAGDLVREMRWLPKLAPHLPLPIPEAVATGFPGCGYPLPWAIYRWLEGETLERTPLEDGRRAAVELARFVADLRRIDTTGAPRSERDRPLAERDREVRSAIASLENVLDPGAVSRAWEVSLAGEAWDGDPVWTHGDLLTPNLLVHASRLSAVIDFGNLGIGDPAVDVIAAWSVFDAQSRAAFRQELGIDDATWIRGRGFALHQALLIIPYYADTNPAFVATALRTVAEILIDSAG